MTAPEHKHENLRQAPPSNPIVTKSVRLHRSTFAIYDTVARARGSTAAALMRSALEASAEALRASMARRNGPV